MTSKNEYSFQVSALRKMPDPFNEAQYSRYFAVAKVTDLPTNLPKDTNPRKQNLHTAVAKKIAIGLEGRDTGQLFHLLNRGLLISAESVIFDNKQNILTLRLPNKDKHGLVDGGHTYEVIKANLENLPYDQYVTIEIMTGIEDDFTEIAGARNTSVQVKDKSLAELEGKLGVIHTLMKGLPFEHDINYVEFDEKDIDVLEVIAILTIFHNDLHKNAHPIYCYSGKAKALKVYLKQPEVYLKLREVVADIFALHDHIKKTMWTVYKKLGGDLGKLKEIGYKDKARFSLYFSPRKAGEVEKIKYEIPNGFTYPILGGLRFLLETGSDGVYKWKTNPTTFYDEHAAEKLIDLTMEASKELGRNPAAVGKSVRHWNGLYDKVVATQSLQK
jgi:hypothetical protein